MDGMDIHFDSSYLVRVSLYNIHILDTHNLGSIWFVVRQADGQTDGFDLDFDSIYFFYKLHILDIHNFGSI